jgi:hypothetical protein
MDPPPSPQQLSGSYSTLSGSGAPSLEHLASQQVHQTFGFESSPSVECTHVLARACKVGFPLMDGHVPPCHAMPCPYTCAALLRCAIGNCSHAL